MESNMISTYAGRQGVGDVDLQVDTLANALEQIFDAVVGNRALQLGIKLSGGGAVPL